MMLSRVNFQISSVRLLDMHLKKPLMAGQALARLVTYLLIMLIIAACDTDQDVSSSEQSVEPANWLSLLSQSTVESSAPGPIEFPVDLNTHPEARAESFVLHALLQADNVKPFSVQVQIDRVALKQGMTEPSAWAYTDVMRASLTVGKQDAQGLVHRESISRLALGLAASERNKLFVGDSQLDIKLEDACNAQYNFSGTTQEGMFVSLTWQLKECPFEQTVGELNQWSTAIVQVTGHVKESGGRQDVSGQGWMLQRFGNLPLPGGAVVIDGARLVLDDRLLLEVSRSRRSTGRGPQTLVSTLRTLGQEISSSARDIDGQWMDVGAVVSASSGASYPEQIRFISEEQGFSLVLTPLVDLPEIIDRLGIRWDGAVKVSGSHEGYGFVNMNPLISSGSR
jgi:predicted secreted hydrolase